MQKRLFAYFYDFTIKNLSNRYAEYDKFLHFQDQQGIAPLPMFGLKDR